MDTGSTEKTPSQRIIGAMGGIRAAARRVHKKPTTVQYWSDKGIPRRHQRLVLDACLRDGIQLDGRPVEAIDFIDESPEQLPDMARAS